MDKTDSGASKKGKKKDKNPEEYFVLENGEKSSSKETAKRRESLFKVYKENTEEKAKQARQLPWRVVCIVLGSLLIGIASFRFFLKRSREK